MRRRCSTSGGPLPSEQELAAHVTRTGTGLMYAEHADVVVLAHNPSAPRIPAWAGALVVAGPEGLTPGVMAESLGAANTTLSFHLKELTRSGLVTQERASRNLVYRAAYERMNGLLGFLTQNCCAGAACEVADMSCKSC